MQCEMCGSSEELFKTMVEGTVLTVCKGCSACGRVISPVRKQLPEKKKQSQPLMPENKRRLEQVLVINPDYGALIKGRRESLGLKQIELAKAIAEKESLIQKMEQGSFEPSIGLARKLERHLRLKLVEEHTEEGLAQKSAPSGVLTLGDILAMKSKA